MGQVIHINIKDDSGKQVLSDYLNNIVREQLNVSLNTLLMDAYDFKTVGYIISEYVFKQGYLVYKTLEGYGWRVKSNDKDTPNPADEIFATYADAIRFAFQLISGEVASEFVNIPENG